MQCDGCGDIRAERPDDDTHELWVEVTEVYASSGGGFDLLARLPRIDFSIGLDDDDDEVEDQPLDDEPPTPMAATHFCGFGCLAEWAARKASESTP